MPIQRSAAYAVGVLLCLCAGCASVCDVSDRSSYIKYIGKTDRLCRECELWKIGKISPTYVIFVPLGKDGQHPYARLPRGTQVKIEAIQQEFDKNDRPYDYAVVTLDDPKDPQHQIRAGVRFQFLVEMSSLGE